MGIEAIGNTETLINGSGVVILVALIVFGVFAFLRWRESKRRIEKIINKFARPEQKESNY